MAQNRKGSNEVSKDYYMLGQISKQLKDHERTLRNVVAKKVAKKAKTDLEEGLLENLDIVATHMHKAQTEIAKAQAKLKLI